jgi:anti-sigma B factor antagonist
MPGYTLEQNGSQCLVKLDGDLTAPVVPDLQADLKKQLDQGASELVFDFDKTGMLDSTGIGLLIAARNSVSSKGGAMRVQSVSQDIFRLLQNMRLIARLNVSGR